MGRTLLQVCGFGVIAATIVLIMFVPTDSIILVLFGGGALGLALILFAQLRPGQGHLRRK